jgi:hypothetical protein
VSERFVLPPVAEAAGRWGPRAALLVVIAALVLAGCGGDDEEQTSTAATQTTTEATAKPKTTEKKSVPEKTTKQSTQSAPEKTTSAGPTPGTKSVAPGVPVSPGGDNSVQLYGAEGEVDQRDQAIATTRTYLNARLAGNWSLACEQMSSDLKQGLKQLTGGAQKENKNAPKGCAGALRALTVGVPKAALRRSARVGKLLSFRVEGEQAFLIFKSGNKAKFMPMDNQDGEWKVGGIEASEFFLGA